jgi:hypothetical protein
MSRPHDDEQLRAHRDLVEQVSSLLTDWNWHVRREPQVGTVRPDLVAETPDGKAYVIEIKTDVDDAHLGSLAQVETFKNALESELGYEPEAVLLLADEAPEKLRYVADDVGVKIVGGVHAEPGLGDLLKRSLSG